MSNSDNNEKEEKGFAELFGESRAKLVELQSFLASFLPSIPGMPAGKFFDIAIGVDVDMVIMAPSPVPMPVPHTGMIYDIMAAVMAELAAALPPPSGNGLAAKATALVKGMAPSVKVHRQWIANAGASIQHIPLFVTHVPLTKPMASSEMWMGSATVLADGCPFSAQFHPALSCGTVGMKSIPRPPKPAKPATALMAPTSSLLNVIAGGPPVLVGGPPTIDFNQLAMKMGMKGLSKVKKPSQTLGIQAPTKNSKLNKTKPNSKCNGVGEPVDMASGKVFSENIDFELPGPIPLQWKRIYYSDAEIDGPLGYNWHFNYNMGIYDMGDYYTLRLADGRETALPKLATGEDFYHRMEKLYWKRVKSELKRPEYSYILEDEKGLLYRFTEKENREGFCMLSEIATKDGFCIRFFYNTYGLSYIIDSRGTRIDVRIDYNGHITGITTIGENDEKIFLVRYRYDDHANMVETLDALDNSKTFIYQGHLLVQLISQNGTSFYWEYEGKGDNAKCIHTWGDGGVLEYFMKYRKGLTTATDSMGFTTVYCHDQRRLIYKIIDANGGITRQLYNDYEELESIIDPEGITHHYTFNEYGLIIKETDANGELKQYIYDNKRRLIKVIYPTKAAESFKYDQFDRVVIRNTEMGEKFTYQYECSLLKRITDNEDRVFIFGYNQQYDLTTVTYPNGLTREWHYDKLGHVLYTRDLKGNITNFSYNALGSLIYMEEPDGNIHKLDYDRAGNLVKARDKLHEVSFNYGPLGTLLSREQNGRSVNFRYDNYLQLKSIVNEGRELYRFELDALGRVEKEIGFDGLERSYLRDGSGRIQKVLRPQDKWTKYRYDGEGNVIEEIHSDESKTAFKYNAAGLLIEAINEEGTIILKRDRSGRIKEEIQGNHSIIHHYDKNGYETRLTSSLGADIHFDYDSSGEIISQQFGEIWRIDWQRDNTGLEIFRKMSGGVKVKTNRDRFGREILKTTSIRSIEQNCVSYNWGMSNRLLSIYNESNRTHTTFDYDIFDNLVRADYTDKQNNLETIYRAPDRIGNLFEQPDRKDRCYSKGGRLEDDHNYYYHYDEEGNLIFKEFKQYQGYTPYLKKVLEKKYGIQSKATVTGWIYEWTAGGMLCRVINPEGGKVHFGYDALGRRLWKEVKGCRTHWVWNGNVPLHEWQTLSPEFTINLVTWIFERGSFVPCGRITNDNSYSIITDHLGTPMEMYTEDGNKSWQVQLDIYGRVRTFEGSSLSDCPFRFQGQYQDQETGLYYNRFRYYDPDIGRFISQDPISVQGGLNIYAYVRNTNTWIDPNGLTEIDYVGDVSPYVTRYDPNYKGRPDPKYSIDTADFDTKVVTKNGGKRDNKEFWQRWAKQNPETLSKGNLYRINELGYSPKIDKKWIDNFPEHAAYKGQTIIHHHVNQGRFAIPVPQGTHVGSGGVWHAKLDTTH